MIKFLSFIFQVIIIIILALFIINNSFIISFELGDFIYSFSSSYFFIFILILIVVIFVIQNLYFKSIFQKDYQANIEKMINNLNEYEIKKLKSSLFDYI